MIKAPINLQELRRRIYQKAKAERVASDGGDGVTSISIMCWGCIGTGKSTPEKCRGIPMKVSDIR